jgi:hypothetical protein
MNPSRIALLFVSTAWTAALLPTVTSLAQTVESTAPPTKVEDGTLRRPAHFDGYLDASYTAAGQAEFRNVKPGKSDAYSLGLGAGSHIPLDEHWFIPVEFRSQNLALNQLNGIPIPDQIHTLYLGAGVGYRMNHEWQFATRIGPTLYKVDDIGGNDIGISGSLTATWNYRPGLRLVFGLLVSPDSDINVLPVVGVDWAINDRYDLRLMLPKPRLTYKLDERWSLHLGADLTMATFRTSDDLGNTVHLTQYNDALGTYRDIRIGGGIRYQFTSTIGLEVETGYSVYRQIEYTRIDESLKFDPAPYFRLGVSARF